MAESVLRQQAGINHLTMVDLDPGMVSSAEHRLEAFAERATSQRSDVTKLPFPDSNFDVVLSFLMLHHVVDWQPALIEVARVLRPGGAVLGYDLTRNLLTTGFPCVDRSKVALMPPGRIRAGLAAAQLENVVVTTGLGGLVMRFAATGSA